MAPMIFFLLVYGCLVTASDVEIKAYDELRLNPPGLDGRRETECQDVSFIQSAMAADSRLAITQETPAHVRPHAGKNADNVRFGILCKKFYGMDLAHGTFTIDLVLAVKWKDYRAVALLPKGQNTTTLSGAAASDKMWMPDIVVTNRAFKGIDIISTSITITDLGFVTKTQRMLAIIHNTYDVRAFPFDRQHLTVRVASSTLMSDELKLVAIKDPNLMGVNDGVFGKEDYSKSAVFEEQDGSLKKSRGELTMSVTRDHMSVIQSVIVSELLLLWVSWSVYFFPLTVPFVMPRVATSVIAFLALMTVSSKTGAMVPGDGRDGLVWIELFNECCQVLVFITFGLNILVETVIHSWKNETLAAYMSRELQLLFPVVAFVSLGFCLFFRDGESLDLMSLVTRVFFLVGTSIYVGLAFSRAGETKADM